MEIIDAHVHVGRSHLPMEEVQGLLDEAGADRAVIFADPESPDIPGDNLYVLEKAQTTGHIPFFYIGGNAYSQNRPFPCLPDPETLEPYRGIKWHCWFTPGHDFGGAHLGMNEAQVKDALTEPGMEALMDKAAGMGIPVNFEEHFDVTIQFVDLYPQINVIIPHMGGLNGGSRRILEAVGRKPNVHFDISLAGISEGLIREFGVQKFICGSDHPYGSPSWSIDRVRKLKISEDERQAVFSGNILSLTGLV
jgi:hypothetical protein